MRTPEFAKTERQCTVDEVDGNPPPNGWKCRCFKHGNLETHSFSGPGFDGQWVTGEPGCQPPAFLVTNPSDGTQYCVKATCS